MASHAEQGEHQNPGLGSAAQRRNELENYPLPDRRAIAQQFKGSDQTTIRNAITRVLLMQTEIDQVHDLLDTHDVLNTRLTTLEESGKSDMHQLAELIDSLTQRVDDHDSDSASANTSFERLKRRVHELHIRVQTNEQDFSQWRTTIDETLNHLTAQISQGGGSEPSNANQRTPNNPGPIELQWHLDFIRWVLQNPALPAGWHARVQRLAVSTLQLPLANIFQAQDQPAQQSSGSGHQSNQGRAQPLQQTVPTSATQAQAHSGTNSGANAGSHNSTPDRSLQNQKATLEFCVKSYTLVDGSSLAEDKLDSFVPVTYGIAQIERSIEERNQRNPFLPDDPDMRDNAAGEILIACAKELELGGTRPTGFKDLKQHILSLYNPQQETFSARFGLLVHIPSTSAVQFLTQVQKLMAVHQVMLTPEYARQTVAKLGNEFLRDSVQTDLRAFRRDHPETADTVTFSLLRRFIETWEANHPHQMQTYSKDRLQQRPTAPRSDDKYFSGRMTEAPRERYRGPRQMRSRAQSYDIDPKDMIPSPNTGKPIPGPRIRHRAQQGDIQESGSPSPSKEQRYNNRDKSTLSRHQVRDMQQNRNSQHTTAAVMTDDQYSEDEGSLVQSADHSVTSDEEYPWEDEYQYSVNAIFLRNSQEIAAGQKECDRMYAMYDSHHMTSEDDESMELSHVLYREWQSSKPKPFQPRFVTKPQVSTANPFQVLAVECDASPHDNTDTTTEYSDVLYQDLQGLPISNRFHNPLVVQDPQPLPVASVECDNNPHKTDTAMTAAITTRTKSGRPVKNPLARDSSVPNTGTQPPGESRHETMDSSAGTNTPDTAAEDTTRTDARTEVLAVPQDTTRSDSKASRTRARTKRTGTAAQPTTPDEAVSVRLTSERPYRAEPISRQEFSQFRQDSVQTAEMKRVVAAQKAAQDAAKGHTAKQSGISAGQALAKQQCTLTMAQWMSLARLIKEDSTILPAIESILQANSVQIIEELDRKLMSHMDSTMENTHADHPPNSLPEDGAEVRKVPPADAEATFVMPTVAHIQQQVPDIGDQSNPVGSYSRLRLYRMPRVQVNIGSSKASTEALVDTGAPGSLMSVKCYEQFKNDIRNSARFQVPNILRAYNASAIDIKEGWLYVPVKFGNGTTIYINFLVVENTEVPIIIGNEVLNAFNCTLRYGKQQQITFHPHKSESFTVQFQNSHTSVPVRILDDPAKETSTTTRTNTKQDTPVRKVRINPTAQYRTIRTRTAEGSRQRKPESTREAGAGARTKYTY